MSRSTWHKQNATETRATTTPHTCVQQPTLSHTMKPQPFFGQNVFMYLMASRKAYPSQIPIPLIHVFCHICPSLPATPSCSAGSRYSLTNYVAVYELVHVYVYVYVYADINADTELYRRRCISSIYIYIYKIYMHTLGFGILGLG